MSQESVWYHPKTNTLGVLTAYYNGFVCIGFAFEIDHKCGPVDGNGWLKRCGWVEL